MLRQRLASTRRASPRLRRSSWRSRRHRRRRCKSPVRGYVVAATGAGLHGKWHVGNDASINSPAFTATSGNGRKDRLILRVDSSTGATTLEIVQGVASASPAEPAITGSNYEELALITLPASTSNITTAMITDRRKPAARGARAYGTAAQRALITAPFVGLQYQETDTGKTLVYQSATTLWTPPWNTAWGVLAKQINTGTGTGGLAVGGAGAETVQLTSAAFTVVPNRLIKVTGQILMSDTGPSIFEVQSPAGHDHCRDARRVHCLGREPEHHRELPAGLPHRRLRHRRIRRDAVRSGQPRTATRRIRRDAAHRGRRAERRAGLDGRRVHVPAGATATRPDLGRRDSAVGLRRSDQPAWCDSRVRADVGVGGGLRPVPHCDLRAPQRRHREGRHPASADARGRWDAVAVERPRVGGLVRPSDASWSA